MSLESVDRELRMARDLRRALDDLAEARQAAAAGEDAVRAVSLLRGLLGVVKGSADWTAFDPYWQMAELILDSVPPADSDKGEGR